MSADLHHSFDAAAWQTELARTYRDDVYERYGHYFIDLLADAIEGPAPACQVLDFAPYTGLPALTLVRLLPAGSRIVAVSDQREALKLLHQSLTPPLRRSIFPRKVGMAGLPFAANVFDLAWACLDVMPLAQPAATLTRVLHSLRPGGRLCLVTPLAPSFTELTDAALQDQHTRYAAQQTILTARPPLLSAETWHDLLIGAGAATVDLQQCELELVTAAPVALDRLFGCHLLPLWLGVAPIDRQVADQILSQMPAVPTTVRVRLGCAVATKALAAPA